MKTTSKTQKKPRASKVCPNCGTKHTERGLFCSNECVLADYKRSDQEERALNKRMRVVKRAREVFLAELEAEHYFSQSYQVMKHDERRHENFILENGII